MKVYWTRAAENHLDGIHRFIAQDSPLYALRMVDRITRRSIQIAAFPRSGRKVPEYDHDAVREVFEASYRIIYHIRSDRIDVLAVIHGAQEALHSKA